jgi:uncharacterized protein YkwD
MANRKSWYLLSLLLMLMLSACGASGKNSGQIVTMQPLSANSINVVQNPTPTPALTIQQQRAPTPIPTKPSQKIPPGTPPPYIPGPGSGYAPYGQPPAMTSEETQLTQQLFAQINHDRAVRGLYPFVWNSTLAGGARLHSWNMFHCGFSHTCPDGVDQCVRIAREGFSFTDCGECIGLAGPSNPPWAHVYAVQESMMNEGPSGWHFIHLTSTTLHRIGVGMYVDPNGWVWFTEDMVS